MTTPATDITSRTIVITRNRDNGREEAEIYIAARQDDEGNWSTVSEGIVYEINSQGQVLGSHGWEDHEWTPCLNYRPEGPTQNNLNDELHALIGALTVRGTEDAWSIVGMKDGGPALFMPLSNTPRAGSGLPERGRQKT